MRISIHMIYLVKKFKNNLSKRNKLFKWKISIRIVKKIFRMLLFNNNKNIFVLIYYNKIMYKTKMQWKAEA